MKYDRVDIMFATAIGLMSTAIVVFLGVLVWGMLTNQPWLYKNQNPQKIELKTEAR